MDDSRLLLSRLDDLIYKYYCGETEGFGFLNELEVSVAHNYLKNQGIKHTFSGGYQSASRMYLYLSENFNVFDDIAVLKIKSKGNSKLTHRDYLGSLMGLGINRECVGDILIKENVAMVFIRRELLNYVLQNLSTVGRDGIQVTEYDGDTCDFSPQLEETEVLVTSMRVDNFITSVCKCSRQKANEYISGDLVFINYSCARKPSKILSCGDTISIRGFGKLKIGEILRNTKSGRLVVSVLQYK